MVLALVLAGVRVAAAQPTCSTANRVEAVRLARQAKEALDEKRYDQALRDLDAADARCPMAEFRHARGCVQEAAGALAEALSSFQACAEEADDEGLRAECRRRAAALQERLRPPAAQLAGVMPGPGAKPTPAAPAEPARTAPPPGPQPGPVAPPPSEHRTLWNWVGVGASVVLIGTGAGFLGQYGRDRADARGAEYYPDGSIKREADRVPPTNAVVGGVCAGLGAAALVTSLVLWPKASAPGSAVRGPRPAISLAPVPGGGVVTFAAGW